MKKAFSECDNCIVLATNDSFVPCMSVMLQSIYENSKPQNKYDIIILHRDVSELSQTILQKVIGDKTDYISLRFLNVSNYIKRRYFYTGNKTHFTAESYYRLLIPWILDDAYKFALYVDGDMIVRRDLYDLFLEPIGDNMIAAVKDYWGICNCYIPGDPRREYRESLGLTDIDHYIIAATLMMQLSKFREAYTLKEVLNLAVSKRWRQHDQDIINVMCQGKIHYYSPAWGYLTDYGNNKYLPQYLQDELAEVEHDPIVIHYAGGRKPWNHNYSQFGMEFWKYAEKTPYFEELLLRISQQDYRYYVTSCLNGEPLSLQKTEEGYQYVYSGIKLGGLDKGHARYRKINIHNNVLHLEGLVGAVGNFELVPLEVYIEVDGIKYKADLQYEENGYRKDIQYMTYRGESFVVDIPLDYNKKKNHSIKLLCKINGSFYERINLGFEKFSPLSRTYRHCYCIKENYIINTDRNLLYLKPNVYINRMISEFRFMIDLLRKKRYKAILARQLYFMIRPFYKKPIWLISDRVNRADDNGEAFFKYLNQFHKKEINSYFIIKKGTKDHERMKQYGKVLDLDSMKFRLYQLMAEYTASSQTDQIFRSAFRIRESYCDLVGNMKFIFLQHGVIVADLTRWLKRRNQQFSGFIVSTEEEYKNILKRNYEYTQDEVWLTGLSRFDYLEDRAEKIITILPSWRRYLAIKQNPNTGIWNLVDDFSSSEYATFYRNLMQNSKLCKRAKELGYIVQFKIHPSFYGKEDAFAFDKNVKIVSEDVSYKEIYEKSSLLITDYSSSIFDFIYLKKPIIYCQFDYKEFFAGNHIYEDGGFNYETEGYGEVEYTLEATVDRIIEYMENDCKLKPIYEERMTRVFPYHDKNNCQRIYEKMIEMRDK